MQRTQLIAEMRFHHWLKIAACGSYQPPRFRFVQSCRAEIGQSLSGFQPRLAEFCRTSKVAGGKGIAPTWVRAGVVARLPIRAHNKDFKFQTTCDKRFKATG